LKINVKTILSVLATIIIIFSIAIVFLSIRAMNNKTLFYMFGYSYSIVPTDSMIGENEDSINPNDFIIIKNVSYEDLNIGDVIVFQDHFNGSITLIVHRIVGEHYEGGFETKGDNPIYNTDPRPVTKDNYLGKYDSKITFLRPLANLVLNQRGIFFSIISSLLFIILMTEIVHILKVVKNEKEEKLILENDLKKQEIIDKLKAEVYEEISKENSDIKPKS